MGVPAPGGRGVSGKLLIFDSHPVQYKAPVYRELAKLKPGLFKVVYYTDCSVRGHRDLEFGADIAWDVPLLDGYESVVLNNERGEPLTGFRSLSRHGIFRLLRSERPRAVLISQFGFEADLVVYLACLFLRIPIWIRHETQDEAFRRSPLKRFLRSLVYRVFYKGVTHAFVIGQLNREHFLRHGMTEEQFTPAFYCVDSTLPEMSAASKSALRQNVRSRLGIREGDTVVLFSGKLIPKKDPGLILKAFGLLSPEVRERTKILFLGSGPLMEELQHDAAQFPSRVIFAGFVNQRDLPGYYLASDILVLPSRRMGETWGLVVNEALHAGCGAIVSKAVGCHPEFGTWERFRVIKEEDVPACAKAIEELARFPRFFDWCAHAMEKYTVQAAAAAIASKL
jgi:glycosyltransferase involved in cell wall biosynthesis